METLRDRETNAEEFQRLLVQRDEFKNYPDLENLAAAVHYNFLDSPRKAESQSKAKKAPVVAWAIAPSIQKEYADPDELKKVANRAAAHRIPDHLALIGFVVEPQGSGGAGSWKGPLAAAIRGRVDRLAEAEHVGWRAERIANGWTYGKDRDDNAKHHPLLVDWAKLSHANQEKDRAFVLTMPKLLEMAGFRAARVEVGHARN